MPQHQDPIQLPTAGNRNGSGGGGLAVRTKSDRFQTAIPSQSRCVRRGGDRRRRGDSHVARIPGYQRAAPESRDRSRQGDGAGESAIWLIAPGCVEFRSNAIIVRLGLGENALGQPVFNPRSDRETGHAGRGGGVLAAMRNALCAGRARWRQRACTGVSAQLSRDRHWRYGRDRRGARHRGRGCRVGRGSGDCHRGDRTQSYRLDDAGRALATQRARLDRGCLARRVSRLFNPAARRRVPVVARFAPVPSDAARPGAARAH